MEPGRASSAMNQSTKLFSLSKYFMSRPSHERPPGNLVTQGEYRVSDRLRNRAADRTRRAELRYQQQGRSAASVRGQRLLERRHPAETSSMSGTRARWRAPVRASRAAPRLLAMPFRRCAVRRRSEVACGDRLLEIRKDPGHSRARGRGSRARPPCPCRRTSRSWRADRSAAIPPRRLRPWIAVERSSVEVAWRSHPHWCAPHCRELVPVIGEL